jgi:tetratricopeptide (TPR) repeat protein
VPDPSRDEGATALASWRGLVFAVVALIGASLLAAWILSGRLNRPVSQAPPAAPSLPKEAPPAPLEPPAGWQPAAGVVSDAHAVSALMLAFEGKWLEGDRHARAMHRVPAPGDVKAARAGNEVGLAHFRAGEYASAVKAFDSASRADPGDAELANNLGYAYLKAGRVREGVPQLIRSLQLAPQRSSAWMNLSEALAALGQDDACLGALLLALRYSTHRDETRDFLADATRTHPSEAFRKQVARALERIDSVPASPRTP